MSPAGLEEIRRQLDGARDLRFITRAMKALSAVRIRQSREAVASLEVYAETVELGLRAALRSRPPQALLPVKDARGPLAAVVFGSDLGLAGRFNGRMVEFAETVLAELEPVAERRTLLLVGSRLAGSFGGAGGGVRRVLAAPGSVDAVVSVVQDLLVELDALRAGGRGERIAVLYNRSLPGGASSPPSFRSCPSTRPGSRISGRDGGLPGDSPPTGPTARPCSQPWSRSGSSWRSSGRRPSRWPARTPAASRRWTPPDGGSRSAPGSSWAASIGSGSRPSPRSSLI